LIQFQYFTSLTFGTFAYAHSSDVTIELRLADLLFYYCTHKHRPRANTAHKNKVKGVQ